MSTSSADALLSSFSSISSSSETSSIEDDITDLTVTVLEGINLYRGGSTGNVPVGDPTVLIFQQAEAAAEVVASKLSPTQSQGQFGRFPNTYVELFGGESVQVTQFQPSAFTHRSEYYYDANVNRLFKKSRYDKFVFWKAISEAEQR
jgi:hypothetical protein